MMVESAFARQVLQLGSAIVAVLGLTTCAAPARPTLPVQIYAAAAAVEPGRALTLRLGTVDPDHAGRYIGVTGATLSRLGTLETLAYAMDVTAPLFPCRDVRLDCDFPSAVTVTLPASAAPGLYFASLFGPAITSSVAPLLVESLPPEADTLLVVPDLTLQAYNHFQNASFYRPEAAATGRVCIGYRRPGLAPAWKYASAQGVLDAVTAVVDGVAVISQWRLARDPEIVLDFATVVLAGHDEYWTRAMLDTLAAWVAAGGRLLNFSGNTMWWRIDMPDLDTVCVDRARETDEDHFHDRLPTVESLLGAGWLDGGFVNAETRSALPVDLQDLHGRYLVLEPDHAAFAGLSWPRLHVFGDTLANIEVDGVAIDPLAALRDGNVVTDVTRWRDHGYPNHVNVLAVTPVVRDGAVNAGAITALGYGKGSVFSAGTVAWGLALAAGDPDVARITRNLLLGQ